MRWWSGRKRIMMVTGASGFLGRHLVSLTAAAQWELLAPTHRSFDVNVRDRVLDEITTWKPNVVVHLAYRNNERRTIVDGSRNVAEAAARAKAHLIHISTDVVFAGREWPYTEADQPDGSLDYGRWKAEAEHEVHAAHPAALIIRTSLLYGTEHQSPAQREIAAVLAHRSSTKYFTDELRCPAHAGDVARAIVTLADRPDVNGVLHVAGPQPISRANLAAAFAAWLGGDPSALPTASLRESGMNRPGIVILDTTRAADLGIRCRSLEEALR